MRLTQKHKAYKKKLYFRYKALFELALYESCDQRFSYSHLPNQRSGRVCVCLCVCVCVCVCVCACVCVKVSTSPNLQNVDKYLFNVPLLTIVRDRIVLGNLEVIAL